MGSLYELYVLDLQFLQKTLTALPKTWSWEELLCITELILGISAAAHNH